MVNYANGPRDHIEWNGNTAHIMALSAIFLVYFNNRYIDRYAENLHRGAHVCWRSGGRSAHRRRGIQAYLAHPRCFSRFCGNALRWPRSSCGGWPRSRCSGWTVRFLSVIVFAWSLLVDTNVLTFEGGGDGRGGCLSVCLCLSSVCLGVFH